MHTTFLQGLWFVLIGVLWTGYFVLEGFDFGVGMLVPVLGRDDTEKRMIIHSIGPVWDGNEVWLLVAGGATFAAFPGWYASEFSGFYIALFLLLAALIVRGISFEFWGKVPAARWRATWAWALAIGSGLAALLFGVAWADFVHGVPMSASHTMTASLWDLLHPYALLGGLVTLSLFLTHGAGFLALRTTGEVNRRATRMAHRTAPASTVLAIGFLIWTAAAQSFGIGTLVPAVAAALAFAALPMMADPKHLFAASCGAVVLLMVTLLAALYPDALPSSTSHAYDLTLATASSSHYTQTVMTVVAIVMVPIVLGYQAWTYWVFRHRLGREDFEGPGTPTPIAVLAQKFPADGRGGAAPATTDAPHAV
jgi:cytochrome d ubiquinol oxidase subunit II